MTYVVNASVWRPGKRVFTRGEQISEQELAAIGPVDSYRRLGLVTEIEDELSGLSKSQLVDQAETLGIEVDGRWGKAKLLAAVKEATDGI